MPELVTRRSFVEIKMYRGLRDSSKSFLNFKESFKKAFLQFNLKFKQPLVKMSEAIT